MDQANTANVNIPNTNVQGYFTQEINNAMAEMSEEEMLKTLATIEGTRQWIAILKYNQIRLRHSQAGILSADPFKDPSGIARNQGVMLGISDLQNAVIILKAEQKEAARAADEDLKKDAQ